MEEGNQLDGTMNPRDIWKLNLHIPDHIQEPEVQFWPNVLLTIRININAHLYILEILSSNPDIV